MPTRRGDSAAPTKGDRRERELLLAAERLLSEGRFGSASVADLAAEAGLSRSTFYFYFSSKQDLLAAAVEAAVGALGTRLTQALELSGGADAAEVVAGTVRGAADLWWEHRVVLVASVELGSALPEVYARNRAAIAEVSQLTGRLLRAVERDADSGLVTALVLMTERNFYDLAREAPPRAAYDDLAELLVTIWLRTLGLVTASDDRRRPALTPSAPLPPRRGGRTASGGPDPTIGRVRTSNPRPG